MNPRPNKLTNKLSMLSILGLLLLGACSGRDVPVVDTQSRHRQQPWSATVVDAARAIPVQHEGRIKPLDTLASFALYTIHGRRDLKFGWGGQDDKVTLTPSEWLLDVFFYPDQAADYPLFRIENNEVFQALWPEEKHARKMDLEFVSYNQLRPVGDRLMQMASDIDRGKNKNDRSPVESALVGLSERLWTYHVLHQQFHLLHSPYLLRGERLQALFGGRDQADVAEVLGKAQQIAALASELQALPPAERGTAPDIARELSGMAAGGAHGAAFFAPTVPVKQQEKWYTLDELAGLALAGQLPPVQLERLARLETAATAADLPTREEAVLAFQRLAAAGAEARGEYSKVEMESGYYAASYSYKALHWFLSGTIVMFISWLFMRQRWIAWIGAGFTVVGLGYLTWDIVLRCLITSRPPIKNLYDTFLFIAATGVFAALITELFTRRRIALSVAPLLGLLLIMLARKFEVMDGSDTMRQLQAVLDSNYWLATHVTTINVGYMAGMLAMLLANVWLLLRAFRIWDRDPVKQKGVVRMVYGVTCFGLLFAVFGTILGGVWANDSWGRFWGWDPKENGALLICLAQTALLHARMSGWVRDFGFCLGAAATGIVVAFSWFHVNLLGVGLHAYGFSSGLKRALYTFYGVQGGLMLVGIVGQLMRLAAPAPARQPGDAPAAAESLSPQTNS